MSEFLLVGATAVSALAAGFAVGKVVSDARHQESEEELTGVILQQNATIQLQSREIERRAARCANWRTSLKKRNKEEEALVSR